MEWGIMKEVKIGGIYRHSKGNLYRVLNVAKSSETLEDFVVYEALYENPSGKIWIRPLTMFLEQVLVGGVWTPRFQWIKDESL